jgi:O-antigen ligase
MITLAYFALWIFVFSLPWEGVIVIPGVAIISRVTGVVALGLALLAVVISARVRRWHLVHVAGLTFVLWTGIALLALHARQFPQKYYTFVQLFAVLWIIWELAPTKKRLMGLLLAFVLGSYVAALDTVLLFRREGSALKRFSAGGADPNYLAMTLALGMAMAWYLAITAQKPVLRWVCRGYLPIGLVAIGLTGSRGGLLATIVALTIVPLTMTKLSPGRLAAALVVLVLAGSLAVVYVPTRLVERFASTGEEVEDLSFGGRFKLWVAGVHVFAENPVLGVGVSGYKNAITPALGTLAQVAHNSYLSVLVEEGIPGFLLFMTMFVATFTALLRLPLLERRFTLILLATLMLTMAPLTWEDHKAVWFVLGVLIGFARADREVLRPIVAVPQPVQRPLARPRPAPRPIGPPLRTPRRGA